MVASSDDRLVWSIWWYENCQGKPMYSEKTCPSATLPIANPICFDLGSNPGRRCGKSATNRLSTATGLKICIREMFSSSLGRDIGYSNWGFSWFALTLNTNAGIEPQYAKTASFQILPNLSFTYHPAIRNCIRQYSRRRKKKHKEKENCVTPF
jgi:hypothetical protein